MFAACEATNAVVGGECAPPFVECARTCVDTQTDPVHCGSCDNACAPGIACTQGICGGRLDGGALDGRVGDADGSSDGSPSDGTPTDGPSGDGISGDGSLDPDACVPPFNTPLHCGACGRACGGGEVCTPFPDGGLGCALVCAPPLINCNNTCVDTDTDPLNCGQCNKVCVSLLCQTGTCVGNAAGHLVVIGHDYASPIPFGGAQARVVANAVFIPTKNPLRVFSFEHYAQPAAANRVKGIVSQVASLQGRTVNYTAVNADSDVPAKLNVIDFDVLVVYDQAQAVGGVLGPLGASWATTLDRFIKQGGTVVILDGEAGSPPQMTQFILSAGLLTTFAPTSLPPGMPVFNIAPADAVGSGVVSPYGATPASVRFVTDPPSGTLAHVIVDRSDAGQGAPVVIHRTVVP